MSKVFLLALSLALLAFANGDNPISLYREFQDFAIDDTLVAREAERVYRLPENVIPLDYDIHLDLYFDENTENPFSYDGRASIVIQAKEENVIQVVLHANIDEIKEVTVLDATGNPVALNAGNQYEIEELYHFLKVNLAQPLTANVNYTLNIVYWSTMNEGPMKRGIWRGWYTDSDGNERIYATTHFQPYNARQAFPCWDEPLFKAVFKLHISRPSTYTGTFSNTKADVSNVPLENNRIRTDFAATPKMSSYLVTLLVSETFTVLAQDTSFNPPIRIIGRSNTFGLANHTLDLAVKMTNFFDDYFGIPYATLHPNLMNDHISSPDWASAGTENWGMVSYRELYLILDESETIMSVEHYAATLVSHELAHKWFGNLITCYWWSNTWINEGYASYFGYIATNAMFPQYEFTDHFNNRYLQTSLAFDSNLNTVPMNHEVNTPAQVTGHFGTISYSKAASFIRMTANIMGLDTFRKSCNYFLMNNPFEPTNQDDLLKAMTQAIEEDESLTTYGNFNFEEYYKVWVNNPGYPILIVEVNHGTGTISLKQERFYLNSNNKPNEEVYPIPISYYTESSPNFDNLKPVDIMTGESMTITKNVAEEWVIFNTQQHGHYRVDYDHKTWTLIMRVLHNDPNKIHHLNRAQIVDDIFALMRSDRMEFSFGFDILRFLATETNFHVWDPAISGFTWFRNRLRHLPEYQAEFDEIILGLMEHAITTLGFQPAAGETPTVTMARQAILHFACTLGHKQCNQDSWDRWVAFKNNNVPINARVRRNVYVTAMREGDVSDFDDLLKRFEESNYANDQLEMLRGMGAAKDPALLTRYLQLTLTKQVRTHDKLNSFNYALLGNQENVKTVVEFVKENIDAIRREYIEDSPARPVHSALSNIAAYLDEPGLAEYELWLRTSQTGIPQFSSIISAIGSARSNIAWGTENSERLIRAARGSGTMAVTSFAMVVSMALILRAL